ncbi:hypothetical protein Celaphus_00015967 [Cervus elaphus hippelaphus]|uniref:Uncharacterized protein n=1 Tax=Cervus elaphus hippelaphus TaxID=46360 RepID=A0A212C2X0_CEREH|nr:hypothetical protein Celaphus_00015967 [Cervus elaphus hippelaphus]
MFEESTFERTYIEELFTKNLVLLLIGKKLNINNMLPEKNTNCEGVNEEGVEAVATTSVICKNHPQVVCRLPFLLLCPAQQNQ